MQIFRICWTSEPFSAPLLHVSRLSLGSKVDQRSQGSVGRSGNRRAINDWKRAEGAEGQIGDATDVDRFSVRAVRKAVRG